MKVESKKMEVDNGISIKEDEHEEYVDNQQRMEANRKEDNSQENPQVYPDDQMNNEMVPGGKGRLKRSKMSERDSKSQRVSGRLSEGVNGQWVPEIYKEEWEEVDRKEQE